MKVIILAGGRATRLPNSAKDIPKALVEIAGKPIIQYQIDLLEKHGASDIRFALGVRANQIIDYLNGKYEYVIEQEPLGTGGAIKFASQDLNEPFMILNGDVICDVNFQTLVDTYQKYANTIVVAYHTNNTDYGLIKVDSEGKIISFTEKPRYPQNGYVNVGIYILQPEVVARHPIDGFSIEYDIFPQLALQNQLMSFEHKGFWIDVGTEERLQSFINSAHTLL